MTSISPVSQAIASDNGSTFRPIVRFGGCAAIAGGLLRLMAAIPASQNLPGVQWLYLSIDCLLLFGLLAIYVRHADKLGRLGLIAFCTGVAAICVIRSQMALGGWTYIGGALALSLSLGTLGAMLRSQPGFQFAPYSWAASIITGAVATALPSFDAISFTVAGALFGVGFVCVGVGLLSKNEPLQTERAN